MYDRYVSHDQAILVSCICPPIPDRNHDFCAHFDNFGEEGPNGFGKDPEAAIHDLWMAASAGDWFDEAFWDEFDRIEAEAAESARENAPRSNGAGRRHPILVRLNEGDVKRHTLDRLDSFVDAAAGERITYKALTQ